MIAVVAALVLCSSLNSSLTQDVLSLGASEVSLASTPRSAHLVDGLAQLETTGAPETAASVRARIIELTDSRPLLGGPIALLAVGVGLAAGGLSLGAVGVEIALVARLSGAAFGQLGTTFLIIGAVGLVVGIPLLVIGAVLLGKATRERRAIKRELETLNDQLRRLSQLAPDRGDTAPQPALTLATF